MKQATAVHLSLVAAFSIVALSVAALVYKSGYGEIDSPTSPPHTTNFLRAESQNPVKGSAPTP